MPSFFWISAPCLDLPPSVSVSVLLLRLLLLLLFWCTRLAGFLKHRDDQVSTACKGKNRSSLLLLLHTSRGPCRRSAQSDLRSFASSLPYAPLEAALLFLADFAFVLLSLCLPILEYGSPINNDGPREGFLRTSERCCALAALKLRTVKSSIIARSPGWGPPFPPPDRIDRGKNDRLQTLTRWRVRSGGKSPVCLAAINYDFIYNTVSILDRFFYGRPRDCVKTFLVSGDFRVCVQIPPTGTRKDGKQTLGLFSAMRA